MYNDASAVEEAKFVRKLSSGHPILSSPSNALVRTLSLLKDQNFITTKSCIKQIGWPQKLLVNSNFLMKIIPKTWI
ncbi:MAG: hypothetical protein CM15mP109_15060 [Candidatus Dadabacteria bacterium]|nr:MAG: hypothetical protein CM15mP109_15060 [Candidatus Dadabacteria bacterium]